MSQKSTIQEYGSAGMATLTTPRESRLHGQAQYYDTLKPLNVRALREQASHYLSSESFQAQPVMNTREKNLGYLIRDRLLQGIFEEVISIHRMSLVDIQTSNENSLGSDDFAASVAELLFNHGLKVDLDAITDVPKTNTGDVDIVALARSITDENGPKIELIDQGEPPNLKDPYGFSSQEEGTLLDHAHSHEDLESRNFLKSSL